MLTKNSTFKGKLRNYSILAGGALATTANGQIVYHALSPPIVLTAPRAQFQLDLNGDGTNDYLFEKFKTSTFSAAVMRFDGINKSMRGTIQRTTFEWFGHPSASNFENKIGPSGQWFSHNNIFHTIDSSSFYLDPILASRFRGVTYGEWNGVTNKYVPFRIKTGTSFNYGWARCSVGIAGDSLTISGYAYQMIPDSSIRAGDTGIPPHLKGLTFKKATVALPKF